MTGWRRKRAQSPYDTASLPVGTASFAAGTATAAELLRRTARVDEVRRAA